MTNPLKGYRFDPETVRLLAELQKMVEADTAGVRVTGTVVVAIAIRNEHARRRKEKRAKSRGK